MDRKKVLTGKESSKIFESLNDLHNELSRAFTEQFNRSLPFNEEIFDRWERAKKLGFGKGSSVYDTSYIFGNVRVGENTWIGPFTIIDGSGGLSIGDNCTISAGTHIYTHNSIARTIIGQHMAIEKAPVSIGDCTYIAPNVIVQSGISIGKHCIIGANSFLNKSIPDYALAVGSPAKIIGKIIVEKDNYTIEYFDHNHE
jgi:acetyltransferase-like isoleucine patch superfamily enzyme